MKVAIGLFWQESNTFNPVPTTMRDFENMGIIEGEKILERFANTTELGGFITAAEEARSAGLEVELAPTVKASAWPGGAVDAETYAALKQRFCNALRAVTPVDGLLLSLHGAMVAQGVDDPEGDLLTAAREIVGDVPIMASCDLHANITPRMMSCVEALRGYHESPHTDTLETGQMVGRIMFQALAGRVRPALAWRKLPLVTPPERHITADPESPFGKLYGRAREMEAMPGVLAASPFSVQPWLDIEDFGSAIVVVTDGDETRAEALADELADLFWSLRAEFLVTKPGAAEALRQALALEGGPIIIADGADSTNSGSPGDATGLLAELLQADLPGPALVTVVDSEAVAQAAAAGVGGPFDFAVGGKRDNVFNQPVRVQGTVRRLGPCRVVLKGAAYNDFAIDMGETAVVQSGEVRVLLSEYPGPGHEPEMYRQVDLEPREAKIVVVKSPTAWRAAYEPFAAGAVLAETPGLSPADLTKLPFQKIARPLWPFDEIEHR